MNNIEKAISDIEEYIENCKAQAFSNTKIVVERPQLTELLEDLRESVPDEVHKFKRIIENRDKLISDAKRKAKEIEEKATAYANHLVTENKITQMANEQAEEIIHDAETEAASIIEKAENTAEEIRLGAYNYTVEMLSNIRSILTGTLEDSQNRYSQLISSLSEHQNIVVNNLNELTEPKKEELNPYRATGKKPFFEAPSKPSPARLSKSSPDDDFDEEDDDDDDDFNEDFDL